MDAAEGDVVLRVERNDRGVVVYVRGEIDLASAPELLTCLQRLAGTVVVDLSDVTFLGTTGISVLLFARKRLESDGGRLTLRNPNDMIARTLEAVALTDWIEP